MHVLTELAQAEASLSVIFVSARKMRALNRLYRGKDYATDVLSFDYDREELEGAPFLGEIVIAPEVALAQAVRYGLSPEAELRKLLVHGILHLLGHDHETDAGEMNRLQGRLLRRLDKQLAPRQFFILSPRHGSPER